MVRPINNDSISLSLEEVTMHAGNKVLLEVDYNSVLTVGNPIGI